MKTHTCICLIAATVCACLTLCLAQGGGSPPKQGTDAEAQIETKFDPAKNETQIDLRAMRVVSAPPENLYLSFQGVYPGQRPVPLEKVYVAVVAISTKGFRFPDVSGITIVADGKRLPMVPMVRFGKEKKVDEYMEVMVSSMRRESFEQVAYADTVVMRFHDVDFGLNATQMQGMREFARLVFLTGEEGPKTEQEGSAGAASRQRTQRGGGLKSEVPFNQAELQAMQMGRFGISTETDEEAAQSRRIVKLILEGKYEEAIPLAESHLRRAEQTYGKESAQVASALNYRARLYRAQGDYLGAELSYKRAIEILEKVRGPRDPNVAVILDNLSWLYFQNGDPMRAEPLVERALSIFVQTLGWESPHVGVAINSLGLIYARRLDFKNAEALFLQSLKILEDSLGKEHPQVAAVLDNLAQLYGEHGFIQIALPLIERSLTIYEKKYGPEHPEVATVLNNLAQRYVEIGEPSRAEPLLTRAVAIRERVFGTDHPELADVLHNLAMTFAEGDQLTRAIAAEARVQSIKERHLSLMLTTGSEAQKQLYARTLRGETDAALSLHLQLAREDPQALNLALTTVLRRKGRVLDAMTEQYGALNRSRDPRDQALRKQLADAQAQLSALWRKPPGVDDQERYRATVAELRAEVERLEAQASALSAGSRPRTEALQLGRVQTAIPADTALVELVLYFPSFPMIRKPPSEPETVPHYAAYVLYREGAPRWVELGEAGPIDEAAARLRGALRNPSRADVRQLARELDERLMRPVRKLLGGKRSVFVSPDGMLNLIPFAALVDEDGRYLVEKYSIHYLTSGRDLLRLQVSSTSKQGPVLIADPLFDGNQSGSDEKAPPPGGSQRASGPAGDKYGRLPGTAEEARALSAILPGATVLTGVRATEVALKQVNGPSILHIATHGFFDSDQPQGALMIHGSGIQEARERARAWAARDENPLLYCGLALAGANQPDGADGEDGILTALEASGLSLWGTELVVLSACETGLGEVRTGEGVYGLRRALVLAGAESQVISLWKVTDDATKDIMTAYYKRLNSGGGRAEALRQVQLKMLHSAEQGHPYFWAGFIASGDWRSLVTHERLHRPSGTNRGPSRRGE